MSFVKLTSVLVKKYFDEFGLGQNSDDEDTSDKFIIDMEKIFKFDEIIDNILVIEENCFQDFQHIKRMNLILKNVKELEGVENLGFLKNVTFTIDDNNTVINGLSRLKNLKRLEIGPNTDDEDILPNIYLYGLVSLTYLDLSWLGLREINCLEDLTSLRFLKLSNNNITSLRFLSRNLSYTKSTGLISLEELNLSHNNISSSNEIRMNICRLKTLKILDLSRNSLNNFECMENFESLLSLNLSHNGLQNVKNFKSNTLKNLNLEGNTKYNFFGNESSFQSLEVLNLSECGIRKIRNLKDLPNLKELDLSDNSIEKINNLSSLEHLESLNLTNNEIRVFRGFDSLVSLKKLYLGGNKIKEVNLHSKNDEKKYFPHSLKILCLSENLIDKISGFENFLSLEELDLSCNRIEKIEKFPCIPNLTNLDMANNNIKHISFSGYLPRLRGLDLTKNKIKQVGNLTNVPFLKELRLGGNKIDRLRGMKNLSCLEKLDLSRNKIKSIKYLLPGDCSWKKGINKHRKQGENNQSYYPNVYSLSQTLESIDLDSNPIYDETQILDYLRENKKLIIVYTLKKIYRHKEFKIPKTNQKIQGKKSCACKECSDDSDDDFECEYSRRQTLRFRDDDDDDYPLSDSEDSKKTSKSKHKVEEIDESEDEENDSSFLEIEAEDRCNFCLERQSENRKLFLVNTLKCCKGKFVLCQECVKKEPVRCIYNCSKDFPNEYC